VFQGRVARRRARIRLPYSSVPRETPSMAMGRGRLPTRWRVGSRRIRDVSRETVPVGRRRRRSAAGSWPGRPLHRGRSGVSRETVRVAGDRGGAGALISRSAAGVVAWPAVGFVAGSAVGSRSGRAFHVKRSRWCVDCSGWGARSRGSAAGRRGRAGVSRETVAVVRGSQRVGRALVRSAAGRRGRAGVSRETVPVMRGSRRVGRALEPGWCPGRPRGSWPVGRWVGIGRAFRANRCRKPTGPAAAPGARSCRVNRRAVVGVGVSRETVPVADAARGGPRVVGWSARRFT
jgi:hypothetical protein